MCIRQLNDDEKSDFKEIIDKGCFVTFNTEYNVYVFSCNGKVTNLGGGTYDPRYFMDDVTKELGIE
ncbi:MAG: hypothetical protein P4L34_06010 [Paludibacter sp.]|nr:hypothetical protein [Paludibacter sp.]